MSLNFDMAPMLGDNFSDSQLAGDHRVLHGGAARGVGSFGGVCRRERARVASRTSETARRRPEAQLGEGALVMRGGERRGREHGIDPPSGGGRAGVQETSIPLVWCSRAWSEFCCSCVLTAAKNAPCRMVPWKILRFENVSYFTQDPDLSFLTHSDSFGQ